MSANNVINPMDGENKAPSAQGQVNPQQGEPEMSNMNLLMDISLRVTVELGRTRMSLRQVMELQNGSVVELDRLAGDPVDIFINERLIAHGEVVVVDDKFGVRLTELVSASGSSKG